MAVVGGVGEVPDPLSVGNVMDKVEGRASDKLRTAMGEMEVGTEEMEEGDTRCHSRSEEWHLV